MYLKWKYLPEEERNKYKRVVALPDISNHSKDNAQSVRVSEPLILACLHESSQFCTILLNKLIFNV